MFFPLTHVYNEEMVEKPKAKRRWPRYVVTSIVKLRGWMDRNRSTEYLDNFSEGGAGFRSDSPLGAISVDRILMCVFEFPPFLREPVSVQARIVHITERREGDRRYTLYGVEFLEAERLKIKPIIYELERLTQLGLAQKS